MLELRNVTKTVAGADHIRDLTLTLRHASLNVLLGPTLSGKTSLMRLMAGLDRPTAGSIWFDGKDVTGVPVQKRGVAMVYQQFINYPAMTVYENIASPLRVAGTPSAEIDRSVRRAAALLRLEPYLGRPAAAHRARPRDRQECRPRPARRAARQSRLQAARGVAGRIAEDLRRDRGDLRLCDDRAS
jgi:ABC-type sugar transport system ATPase subunit